MRIAYRLFAILLCTAIFACGHITKPSKISKTFEFSKDSVSLEVEVILPESYSISDGRRYPVVYLLDGFWNKDPMVIAYNSLRFDNVIPEAIIVSVGYPNKIESYEEQRMWDLTPTYDSGFKAGGNGSTMLDLISNRVVPFINDSYRVDNQRTILTGHSLAGLLTLYVMYKRPKTFTHYVAISPSALWSNNYLERLDQEFSSKSNSVESSLYITYGTDEYVPYVEALEKYIKKLIDRGYQGLDLEVSKVEGMRHVSMKAEGYMRGIVWSFSDMKPSGPSEFEKMNIEALSNSID